MVVYTERDKTQRFSDSTFRTHLNYIKCVDILFEKSRLDINIRTDNTLNGNKITKFEALARITKQSIDNELSALSLQKEYVQVVAPWIPVKCYYRLYYLESIFIYLLNDNDSVFKQRGHSTVRNGLQSLLRVGSITFSNSELNSVINLSEAMNHRTISGSTIRSSYFGTEECIKSVRKKTADYIELSWRDGKNLKLKKIQEERKEFIMKKNVTIVDFFYWMRIKANYRDVDFLDFDNISPSNAVEYVMHYVSAVDKYAHCLEGSIADLKAIRIS